MPGAAVVALQQRMDTVEEQIGELRNTQATQAWQLGVSAEMLMG